MPDSDSGVGWLVGYILINLVRLSTPMSICLQLHCCPQRCVATHPTWDLAHFLYSTGKIGRFSLVLVAELRGMSGSPRSIHANRRCLHRPSPASVCSPKPLSPSTKV